MSCIPGTGQTLWRSGLWGEAASPVPTRDIRGPGAQWENHVRILSQSYSSKKRTRHKSRHLLSRPYGLWGNPFTQLVFHLSNMAWRCRVVLYNHSECNTGVHRGTYTRTSKCPMISFAVSRDVMSPLGGTTRFRNTGSPCAPVR